MTSVRIGGRIALSATVLVVLAVVPVIIALGALTRIAPPPTLHYAPNGNFGSSGGYLPGKAGFNVADVGRVDQVAGLPLAVKGLVWVGLCGGVDDTFLKKVQPFLDNSKVFGFFLMDDPDPRGPITNGSVSRPCTAENLKAESDWIHAHARGKTTLITLMNMSSSKTPSFKDTYNAENSHVDLFGIGAYPCRVDLNGCDFAMIDRYVVAATAEGVPADRIVPIYQAFGGGTWVDDAGGRYLLPTAENEREIIARWGKLIKNPVLDAAYSWGTQDADASLEGASDLQDVFSRHNAALPR